MTPNEYQDAIVEWHSRRWPGAHDACIALKLAEECGEVAEVVCKELGSEAMLMECSDVLNVVCVLLDRFGSSLEEAMEFGATVVQRKPERFS